MTTTVRPIVSVRFHKEDGGYWAEAGNWTAAASTLAELRTLAREGAEFMFGGKYRSHCYFEFTETSGGFRIDPMATEEFRPAEETNDG